MAGSVGEDALYGTKPFADILQPADEIQPQTDSERCLKQVVNRLKDVHRVQSAELVERRNEIERQAATIEQLRSDIDTVHRVAAEARNAELEKVRHELKLKIKQQRDHSRQLTNQLAAHDATIQGKDRELCEKDAVIEERQRAIGEKDLRIAELTTELEQMTSLLGLTREERDKKHADVGERMQVVDALEDKLRQKELALRQNDEETAKIRERVDTLFSRSEDLEKTNKELEIAIEKTRYDAELREQKLKMTLTSSQLELEEIKLQSQQFSTDSEFTEKTVQDLLDDNKDKDEMIFRTTAVVVDQQIREQEWQDMNRFKMHELQDKLRDLRSVDDGLLYAVTNSARKGGLEPWRVADPECTLVECFPMCSPTIVGQPVTIVITTRNRTGQPVKSAFPTEIVVSVAGKSLGVPDICAELTAPSEGTSKLKKPKLDKESSSFTTTHFATSPGWKEVTVKFRGEIIRGGYFVYHSSEEAHRAVELVPRSLLTDGEAAGIEARCKLLTAEQPYSDRVITLSCNPVHARPGEEVQVCAVVRDSKTYRPYLGSEDLSSEISLSPFFGGDTVKPEWLQAVDTHHRLGVTQVYQSTLKLPQDDSLRFTGVIGTFGTQTTSALCWMAPPSDKGRVDFGKTLISCYPDPCTPGEVVTCNISTRGSEYEPALIEDGQHILFEVRGINGVSRITPVEKINDYTWRTTFTAQRRGRSGLNIDYSGQPLGQCTVEVQGSNSYVPANCDVQLNPCINAKPGQRVYVTIRTKDVNHHLASGPPSQAFNITPVGSVVQNGSHKIHALARSAVDGVYTTHFTVADDAEIGSVAGIDVALEGASISKTIQVTSDEGTHDNTTIFYDPPIQASFTCDPVRAEEAAFIVVSAKSEPQVVGGYNVMYVGQPVEQKWCPGVWMIRVQIGSRQGFSSVTVEADGKTLSLSVSVDTMPVKTLEMEIERLRDIEMKFRESWDGKWRGSVAGSQRGSRAGSVKGSRSSLKATRETHVTPRKESASPTKKIAFPKIGVELVDHFSSFGEEDISGAKVVEVRFKEAADNAGLQPHDIITQINCAGSDDVFMVSCKDDFRTFLKSLGTKAPFPDIEVKIRRIHETGSDDLKLTIIPGVSEKEVKGKRSRKTSPRRSSKGSTRKRSTKKKSTRKKKSTKKKSTRKKKSTKKRTSKKSKTSKTSRKSTKKSKKKGIMSKSQFQGARAAHGTMGRM